MGSHCCFKLVYRVTNGAYVWNANNCNLSHSYPIAPKPMTFDGRTEINMIGELTGAEERFIKEQTLSRTNVPNLQVNMERERFLLVPMIMNFSVESGTSFLMKSMVRIILNFMISSGKALQFNSMVEFL